MQRILLVTGNEADSRQVTGLLANEYQVAAAVDVKMAADLAAKNHPALILADVGLAGTAAPALRELADRQEGGPVPLIFITAADRPTDVATAFASGGQDHVAKPFCVGELSARLGLHLQLSRYRLELGKNAATIERKNYQLRDLAEQIESSARIDMLTAIPNRWYMLERMKDEVARAFRHQRPFTVVAVNIDGFSAIVGERGRECSDYVLQSVADILRTSRRGEDIVCRWGGDVFLILLPETYIADGGRVAERIRAGIATAAIAHQGEKVPVTATVGVVEFAPELGIEGTIRKAEAAVTAGKRTRNCVVLLPR